MANFFVSLGEDQSIFQLTTDTRGSGSTISFLHPWKVNLYIDQTVSIGLSGGYYLGNPLQVTSNAKDIADDPRDKAFPKPDRIFSLTGKAKGMTLLEVRDQGRGEPWCWLQVEVKQRPGFAQGWIGPAGDANFNGKVLKHIGILKASPSFQRMWDLILETGYRVTILPAPIDKIYDETIPQIPKRRVPIV
jgi:hypothetical protein